MTNVKLQIFFIYEVIVNPIFINCLHLDKSLTFHLLAVNMVGFNLSCSNSPHKIFPSNVISR